MIVTGIGSREAPEWALDDIREYCNRYSHNNILRSGGASGCDEAFELNWKGIKEIYHPWEGFTDRPGIVLRNPEAVIIAKSVISKNHWNKLSRGGKLLHTRNVHQILGKNLDEKSDIVICYCVKTCSSYSGGTATALKLAMRFGIKVVNLYEKDSPNTRIFYDMIGKIGPLGI